MKAKIKELKCNSRGTIMLESFFSIIVCIIVMLILLALGFYIYQVVMVKIVTNEIAEDVVVTYKYKNITDSTSISWDDIDGISRYRYLLFSKSYDTANEKKGKTLANMRLSKTSFALTDTTPKVEIESVNDDVGRIHYKVTISQRYEFFLSGVLDMIGLDGTTTISSSTYVESVDMSNYINSVKFTKYLSNKLTGQSDIGKMINSALSILNSIKSLFKL